MENLECSRSCVRSEDCEGRKVLPSKSWAGVGASIGVTPPAISKYTLIVGWAMCYERGVHRLLQKQGRVLLEH